MALKLLTGMIAATLGFFRLRRKKSTWAMLPRPPAKPDPPPLRRTDLSRSAWAQTLERIESFRWTGDIDQVDDPMWIAEAIERGAVRPQHVRGTPMMRMVAGPAAFKGDFVVLHAAGEIRAYSPNEYYSRLVSAWTCPRSGESHQCAWWWPRYTIEEWRTLFTQPVPGDGRHAERL